MTLHRSAKWGAWRARGIDIAVCSAYISLAIWVMHRLWVDPDGRVLALNPADQVLNEWSLAHDTRLWYGDLSLVTDRLNVPEGVNLMANASLIALGAAFTPVTLLWSAATTHVTVLTFNLAATASAWYFLFRKGLRLRSAGPAVGGAFCGFAPGMISQSQSHLHMTAQFLVPAILWCTLLIARTKRNTVPALLLGLLVALQVFIGEEVLLLTALGIGTFLGSYAIADRQAAGAAWKNMLRGLALSAAVTLVVVVYPLWVQFAGRQHVSEGVFSPDYFFADVASMVTFPRLSLFGNAASAAAVAPGPTEENAFFGWPLLLFTGGCAAALWPRPTAKAVTATVVVFALLSFGPTVTLEGKELVAGPFRLLREVPLIEAALPVRFGLVLIPLIGLLLALALDEAQRLAPAARLAVGVAVIAALVPIVPVPLPTVGRAPVPEFVASGLWRQCTRPGGTLVPIPLPTPAQPEAMRWAAAARAEFALPQGFFIGPYGADGGPSIGIFPRPIALLLEQVLRNGVVPTLGPVEFENLRHDLSYWRADCVVLAETALPAQDVADPLLHTVTSLLGPPRRIADAWVWDVREGR